MSKKWTYVVLALTMVGALILSACAKQAAPTATPEPAAPTATPQPAAATATRC